MHISTFHTGKYYSEKRKTYPYLWEKLCIIGILNNMAYLGYVVNGKTTRPSFKSKKVIKQSSENFIFVFRISFLRDCDRRMYYVRGTTIQQKYFHYICSGSKKHPQQCSSHYVRKIILQDYLKKQIQKAASYISSHKKEFEQTFLNCRTAKKSKS